MRRSAGILSERQNTGVGVPVILDLVGLLVERNGVEKQIIVEVIHRPIKVAL